ncbi:hypothetical protein HID58_077195 [Brassica napus]|uniref:DUF4378 domain-containing protein n=1 Tax=Brassica napus TaxID=3708 RepID=A0ABQ7YPZ7_BRANA|nr:hypothetical protein HID58_077195 [Brassica napus]
MQESGIYNDKRIKRGENLIKCNITFDGGLKTGKHDWKKEMDVISFTFSSQNQRERTSKLESSSCSLVQEEYSRSKSESVSNCTSFYDKQKFQMMQTEEQELSSTNTVTEADQKLLQQEFKKMREMMIYQLVDKEMSSIEGSWLCFEKDTYGVRIDIEGEIVPTLVDELVNDLVSGVQRKASSQGNELVSALVLSDLSLGILEANFDSISNMRT